MSSSPWAQAVEAMRHTHWLTAKRRPEPSVPLADDQYAAMLRAALPHLLAAVVGEMHDRAIQKMEMAAANIPFTPDDYSAYAKAYRKIILAALTDAAGRI